VSASADKVAAVAPPDDPANDTTPVTIAPPVAVVQADANIPINEAVVGAPANLPVDYSADFAPPVQAAIETQPPQPDAEHVWVPGYWWWSRPLARYVWVGGAWRRPPTDQVWVAGSWAPHGPRFVWTPGYWGPRGYAREVIDVAPPPLRVEVRPVSPGVDFVWTPGFYAHRAGVYAWTPGVWVRPPHPGVVWVEPRYIATGGRYCLQPGRWDVAVERRGVVYQPDINVRPGARVVLAPVAPTVVVEHARFVADSSRAVAHGVVRAENGTYVVPRAIVHEHIVEHPEHPEHLEHPEHPEHVVVDQHVHVEEHIQPEVHGRVDEHEHHVNVAGHAPEVHVESHVTVPHVESHVEVHQQPQPQQQQHPQGRPPEHEQQRHR
jgi:hypothetical protein